MSTPRLVIATPVRAAEMHAASVSLGYAEMLLKLHRLLPVEVLAGSLEELWLTGVAIQDVQQLEPLRSLTSLSCVYLEHSPYAKAFGAANQDAYQQELRTLVPSLSQIDALCL